MLEMQDQLQEALVQFHRVCSLFLLNEPFLTFMQCLSIDYNHVMARIRIAMIALKAKDYNLAEQLLSSLLRLEPTCHQVNNLKKENTN